MFFYNFHLLITVHSVKNKKKVKLLVLYEKFEKMKKKY